MEENGKAGKYDLRAVVGRGAAGVVFEGFDPVLARKVAIKTLPLDQQDDEAREQYTRFQQEAQAAGRLHHPNIVAVFDYGETPTHAFIVMEYLPGGSLKSRLEGRGRMSTQDVVTVMLGILAGLQHSHEHGVVHRDIKPANIVFDEAGTVKITDFGIARLESSKLTMAGTLLGTPAYMSPEQVLGETADLRSDIYSAGVILYELLTGQRPFEGQAASIMHKIVHAPPPQPSGLPAAVPAKFDAIVARALAKAPDDRYQSAAEFANALRGEAPAALPLQAGTVSLSGEMHPPSPEAEEDRTVLVETPATATAPAKAAANGGVAPTGAAQSGDVTIARPPPVPPSEPLSTTGQQVPNMQPAVPGRPPRSMPLVAGAAVAVLLFAAAVGYLTIGGPRRQLAQIPPPPIAAPSPGSSPTQPADPAKPPPIAPLLEPGKRPGPVADGTAGQPPSPPPSDPPRPVSPPTDPAPSGPPADAPALPPPQRDAGLTPPPPIQTPLNPPQPDMSAQPKPSVQTPAVPAPAVATPADPVAAMRSAVAAPLAALPCAFVRAEFTAGRGVTLSGVVGIADGAGAVSENAVRGAIAAVPDIGAIDVRLRQIDGPFCGVLSALAGGSDPAAADSVAIAPEGDPAALASGGTMRLRATLPGFASALRVDRYTADGAVIHLLVPDPDAPPQPPGASLPVWPSAATLSGWMMSPGERAGLVAAIASAVPLALDRRPLREPAAAYLADFTAALNAAKAKGRVSTAITVIGAPVP